MTPRQQRFVQEYLVDLNATQAAKRAGYSEDTAGQVGHENLKKPEIAEAIQKAMGDRAKRTQVTADRVIEELSRIAFYNPGRVFYADQDGLPRIDFSDATEEDWRVVAEVTNKTTRRAVPDGDGYETTTEAKVKHQCKQQALTALGRHFGLFNDKVQHSYDLSNLSDEELNALERITAKVAEPRGHSGGAGETPASE